MKLSKKANTSKGGLGAASRCRHAAVTLSKIHVPFWNTLLEKSNKNGKLLLCLFYIIYRTTGNKRKE